MAKAPQGVVPSDASVNLFYKIIANAYNEIFDKITNEDLTKNWRRKQTLKQIENIVAEANEDVKAWIKVEIPAFYENGMFETVKGIYKDAGDVNVDLDFVHFHKEAIEAISRETYQEIASGMTGLTRTGERMIAIATRDSVLKNIITGQITGDSAREIRKQIENTLKSEGITALTDRAGRRWDLKRYGEMLARTKLTQAHNSGVVNRMAGGGYDLVMITAHGGSCPLCVPWQGQVLSVSGISNIYPSLDEARGGGLFHPNCRHAMTPYHADFLENTQAWDANKQEYVAFGDLSKKQQVEEFGMTDFKVFRGTGSDFQAKLKSTDGQNMFGNGLYVARDAEIAKKFGDVEEMSVRLKNSEILTINNQGDYEALVKNVIKKYPNDNPIDAIPKYAKSLGYKAIQGSRNFDPLAGINILDQSIVRKDYLLSEAWNSTVGMKVQYSELGIKFDGSEVLPSKMTTHIIDDFARKVKMNYGKSDEIIDEFHSALDGKNYKTLEKLQDDLLATAKKLNIK